MSKFFWYEVFTYNQSKPGTSTIETFDTLSEAQEFINEHQDMELFVDEWQMNSDGSGMLVTSLI